MAKGKIRKRLAELGKKKVSVTLHGEFYRAALDNLAAAIEIQEKLEGNSGGGFDSVNKKYQEKDRQYRMVLVSVVFSATTAEALINHYGTSQLGETCFKKWYDKLSPPLKWLFVPRSARSVSLGPGREPFQGLDGLMRLRNDLVHYRPARKTLDELWKEEHRAATLDDARRAALTVHRLADWLHAKDPDFDLGQMTDPSDACQPMDFLEAYESVLGERPR